MSDQPVIVHQKFVLFGFATENRVIFQDQACFPAACLALEE
jgi:hypothetical protein